MDKSFRINFRVPEEFRALVQNKLTKNNWGDSDFMLEVLKGYFNPPEPEIKYVDKIVEVPIEVAKDKIVHVDNEGTVIDGVMVKLSTLLATELLNIKHNPEESLDLFVGGICWRNLKFVKDKKSGVKSPQNSTSSNISNTNTTSTVSGEESYAIFEEYKRRRVEDCFEPSDWVNLRKEIESNPNLNAKQKRILTQ